MKYALSLSLSANMSLSSFLPFPIISSRLSKFSSPYLLLRYSRVKLVLFESIRYSAISMSKNMLAILIPHFLRALYIFFRPCPIILFEGFSRMAFASSMFSASTTYILFAFFIYSFSMSGQLLSSPFSACMFIIMSALSTESSHCLSYS